jgi:hypothetical protein
MCQIRTPAWSTWGLGAGTTRPWVLRCSQTRLATQPLISDTIPANGSVITIAWPVISATLYDPEPGSGVQPLSTTLIIDGQVVTPQVNTTSGFAYTPTVRLTEGVHSVTAQVYDQAGNQTQSGPWSFTIVDDSAPPGRYEILYAGRQLPQK